MKKILLILICIAGQSGNGHAQIVSINGAISLQEKMDTIEYKIVSDSIENILIKKNSDFYYLGVHNSTLNITNIILNKGAEFTVIHISACTGRAIYQQTSTDSVKVMKPILSVVQHPEAWDVLGRMVTIDVMKTRKSEQQMFSDMKKCLKRFGYMANTMDMGSYHDVEVLLDRKFFQGYRLLIQYTGLNTCPDPPKRITKFYPAAGYTDDMRLMQIFMNAGEKTSLKIKLNTEKWIVL